VINDAKINLIKSNAHRLWITILLTTTYLNAITCGIFTSCGYCFEYHAYMCIVWDGLLHLSKVLNRKKAIYCCAYDLTYMTLSDRTYKITTKSIRSKYFVPIHLYLWNTSNQLQKPMQFKNDDDDDNETDFYFRLKDGNRD
jgi:hypothetical protein